MKNIFLVFLLISISACGQSPKSKSISKIMTEEKKTTIDTATVGGGCFWCTEAQFQVLDGVISVQSGFSGGSIKNPSYKEVCMGTTGHAEVVQVVYDTTKLNYEDVLKAFFESHDPTTLNRQGNDVGTQYRSVIFYHSPEQKKIAEQIKTELNASGAYTSKVVTEISPYSVFYKADDSHQNYFNENKEASYCQFVIAPKLEKFKKVFKGKLKGAEH
ncbi:MAG: peptide-methionine (S)-S-oxide reductase MsrA [Bacteroidota bacterium]